MQHIAFGDTLEAIEWLVQKRIRSQVPYRARIGQKSHERMGIIGRDMSDAVEQLRQRRMRIKHGAILPEIATRGWKANDVELLGK